MAQPRRYVIGIDLGTTNTAVAFVDTTAADPRVETFEVPQLVAPGALDRRRQLPSFVYLAGEHDLTPAQTALPWQTRDRRLPERRWWWASWPAARARGQPSRMIASAKSWLCHPGVDRQAAILPWGVEQGPRLSPVEASARVLAHVRAAWDHRHRDDPEAPLGRSGRHRHRPRLVRRGRARADGRGRRPAPAWVRWCCWKSRRPPSTPG